MLLFSLMKKVTKKIKKISPHNSSSLLAVYGV